MDISAEIAAIQAASQGSELRQPLVGALNKLNTGSLPAVTASDAGKILKVGANGWEVGEKSGYMPVPTATKQITENGTHDVTDYASAVVNVSGGGGSILIPKTITQNGTYDPVDDNADGYSSVIVNVDTFDLSNLYYILDGTGLIVKQGGLIGPFSSSQDIRPYSSNGNALNINWSDPFKINVSFIPIGTKSDYQFLIGPYSGNFWNTPSIQIDGNLNAIFFELSSNGTSATATQIRITNQDDGLNLQANTKTWCKAEYDGTNYKLTVFDGTNTIVKSDIAPSPVYTSNTNIAFGRAAWYSGRPLNAVIDLFDTYIESNGVLVWGGKRS